MRAVRLCCLIALTLAVPASASAKWTRVTSEHFVFVGDASERTLRNTAQRLELFRETLGRLFAARDTESSTPTVVVVFQNDRSFTPFKPHFEGKPIALAGVFSAGDTNFIAVNAEQDNDAYAVIFHEYAHFLVANAVGSVPPWINEGLAQFYQTFELRDGGKSAMIGMPNLISLRDLQSFTTWIPIPQLLAVDYSSSMYNEGDRRGLFYAESWALVHYLSLGNPQRAGQLSKYLDAIRHGRSSVDAFTEVFGGDPTSLERELHDYSRRLAMKALQARFDDKVEADTASKGEVIDDREMAAYLGELLVHVGRDDDARAYLKGMLARGDAPQCAATLGALELRAGHADLALPLFEQAMKQAPDDPLVLRAYGIAMARRASLGQENEDELSARARDALTKLVALRPRDVDAMVSLARLQMDADGGAVNAVALLRRATAAAPGREEYAGLLARAYVRMNDYENASNVLGPLVARGKSPGTRQAALQMLAYIAAMRNAALGNGRAAGVPELATIPFDATELPRRTARGGEYKPVLRVVGNGETRVDGKFSAVECQGGVITLNIDTATGAIKMAVSSFDEIEFLTYRPDSPSNVACGPQQPSMRVLATFRSDRPVSGAATSNRAVAVELVPDDFVP